MGEEEKHEQLALGQLDAAVAACANKHSAAYLKKQNSRLYDAIVMLIDLEVTPVEIAKTLKVSRNLVTAIARQQAEEKGDAAVEQHKRRMLAGLRRLQHAAIQRATEMIERGDEVSVRDLGIIAGIAFDKDIVMSGGVTSRVEVRLSPDEQDGIRFYDQLLSRASQLGMVMDAEILPQTAGLGSPSAIATELQQRSDQGPDKPLDTPAEPSK